MDAALLLLLLAGTCVSTINAASTKHPLAYDDNKLLIKDQSGKTVVDLGAHLTQSRSKLKDNADAKLGDGTSLRVAEYSDRCLLVEWNSEETNSLMNCFPLGNANWYGGGEEIPQKWPLERYSKLEHSMVTQEAANRGIADPFWFNSEGLSIYVAPGVPLWLSLNGEQPNALCLQAKIAPPYRSRPMGFRFTYYVCKSSNPKEAFMHAVDKFLGKPAGYPDERMIMHPVWSTWAKYKADINETAVRAFAKEIKDNGFDNSQFEIDDAWETCYGSKKVNTTRFPDMKKLTTDLKSDGFRVTIWTHPFIQLDCTDTLREAAAAGYLVKNATGYHTHWWNGEAAIIDFTKPGAQKWFIDKHKKTMDDNGLDGYKFDAGETSWNPQLPDFSATIKPSVDEEYPSLATKMYVKTCAEFGNISEVRSAYRTQQLPIFLRMIDKDTRWGDDNGLTSLVTTLLQMNMVGYSMVLPDMIGGNQYNGALCSKELFIRWLQANTFMPALQYALVPWDYDNQTVEIAKKYAKLHVDYTPTIINAMKQNVKDGTPVNPPIWWIDPEDKEALKEGTEYLLADTILVAPVLTEGAVLRDVYLPKGRWKDGNTAELHDGPKTIKDYNAPLDILPWFIKADGANAASSLSTPVLIPISFIVLISLFISH